jgi:hypothetical protein
VIQLRPIQTAQTFSIIPSSYEAADLDAATLSLTENGTYQSELDVTYTYALSSNENFVEVTVTPTIELKEDQIYTLELGTDTNVFFRDVVYVTSKTDKKEVFSYPSTYTEYGTDDDYIVL